jgi:hypothetical protein
MFFMLVVGTGVEPVWCYLREGILVIAATIPTFKLVTNQYS